MQETVLYFCRSDTFSRDNGGLTPGWESSGLRKEGTGADFSSYTLTQL